MASAEAMESDTIVLGKRKQWFRSLYILSTQKRSKIYNAIWGKHYRDLLHTHHCKCNLYTVFLGDVEVTNQAIDLRIILENKVSDYNFIETYWWIIQLFQVWTSFRKCTIKKISKIPILISLYDVYTIINPYTFLASDYMAASQGSDLIDLKFRQYSLRATNDTVMDGTVFKTVQVFVFCLTPFSKRTLWRLLPY